LAPERPDERSVMTYVSEYFHRFAQQDLKEIAARRAQKFVNFARRINARKHDYEQRVKALLEWVQEKEKLYSVHKFGETLDDATKCQADLKVYYLTEKPPKIAEKMDIEALFAEIQTELKVNDRPPYIPPAELSPEAVDNAWDRLVGVERQFGVAARNNRYRFIAKEESQISAEKIQEFKESFAHFDANKNNTLDRLEFKAAAGAMSVPFRDEACFNKVFSEVAEGKTTINLDQFLRYMTKLQQDTDTPEQLTEAFRSLAHDADTVTPAQLAVPPLTEEDVKFLVSQMPDRGSGQLDYREFINHSFASGATPTATPTGTGTTPTAAFTPASAPQ